MRMLFAQLLAATWVAVLATAETPVPDECLSLDLSLNTTNVDTLANCTLYSYECVGTQGVTYLTTPPPTNCTKLEYNLFFNNYNTTGPLVVPRVVQANQVSIDGYSRLYANSSTNLRLDSIDFPDLVNITHGLYIQNAQNVSSLKFPKLENIELSLNINLSAGPVVSLSFPKLRVVHDILITGKIDALEFPALNSSHTIEIISTGDLDCVAFAATALNTTFWPTGYQDMPKSLMCSSNKNNISTNPTAAEDTSSGNSGVSWFRGDLLLLAVFIGSASLVV